MAVAVKFATAATSACVNHRPSSRPASHRQTAENPDGVTPDTAPGDSDWSATSKLTVGCTLEHRVLTRDEG